MPGTTIRGNLAVVGSRVSIKNNHFNFTLHNTGSNPLANIRLRLRSTKDPDDPGITIASADSDFVGSDGRPISSSAIQMIFQDNSSGEPETIAPNTLPAGSRLSVGVALTTQVLQGYDSYEVEAACGSGLSTVLSLFAGG